MREKIMSTVLGFVIVTLCIVTYVSYDRYLTLKREVELNASTVTTQSSGQLDPNAPVVHFVGQCSGLDMSIESAHLNAVSHCLGRIQGFVDGHSMSVAMVQLSANKGIKMWCMAPTVTTEQLFTAVLGWIDNHPDEYIDINSNLDGNTASMVTVVKALQAEFPCVNS